MQFVTKSWPDIRRKIERLEDWQEKGINELLREALKVYLRRDEEKNKLKAKIMVAVARESLGASDKYQPEAGENQPKPSVGVPKTRELPSGVSRDRKFGASIEGRTCFYCGEVGHKERLQRT